MHLLVEHRLMAFGIIGLSDGTADAARTAGGFLFRQLLHQMDAQRSVILFVLLHILSSLQLTSCLQRPHPRQPSLKPVEQPL